MVALSTARRRPVTATRTGRKRRECGSSRSTPASSPVARLPPSPLDPTLAVLGLCRFRVDRDSELLCSRELSSNELTQFREALAADYYFQARGEAGGNRGLVTVTRVHLVACARVGGRCI